MVIAFDNLMPNATVCSRRHARNKVSDSKGQSEDFEEHGGSGRREAKARLAFLCDRRAGEGVLEASRNGGILYIYPTAIIFRTSNVSALYVMGWERGHPSPCET